MTSVIGFSGKKQSGKNTAANFVLGTVMKHLGYTKGFKITPKGELYVFDLLEDVSQAGIFDILEDTQRVQRFKEQWLDNHIKIYSFADALKQDVCMNILGLSHSQCYGTDEQKNTPTHLKWEDMPGVITFDEFRSYSGYETSSGFGITMEVEFKIATPLSKQGYDNNWCGYVDEKIETDPSLFNNQKWLGGLIIHEPGAMTAREVMQFAGTELFRKMYNNVWVDATIRKIKNDRPRIAVICDVRFHNEGDGIYDLAYTSEGAMEGYVVRLLRDPNEGQDQHESETAMDNYPVEKYKAVIDNRDMSVNEQNIAIYTAIGDVLVDRKPF